MPRYRFEQIAINSTEKRKPTESDMATYIGLEHMDSHSLTVKRWGSDVPIIGDKLVMKKGDVLLGKRNAYLRRAAIAPFNGLFSAHGMVLRPKTDVIDKDFFPIFIASDYFFDEAIRISVGSLSPTINWKDLKDVEFNLPALDEQRKLAKILWSIIKTTNSYQEMLEKQDLLIKSQFIEMFGIPIVNDFRWRLVPVSDACSIVTDGSHFSPKDSETGYPMLSVKDMGTNGFNYTDCKHIDEDIYKLMERQGCVPQVGDVLVAKDGSYFSRAFSIKEFKQQAILSSIGLFKPKQDVILPDFLVHYLMSDEVIAFVENGYVTGSALKRVIIKGLKSIPLYLPPLELQKKFLLMINQIDKSKFEIEKSLSEITKLYQKIIRDSLKP